MRISTQYLQVNPILFWVPPILLKYLLFNLHEDFIKKCPLINHEVSISKQYFGTVNSMKKNKFCYLYSIVIYKVEFAGHENVSFFFCTFLCFILYILQGRSKKKTPKQNKTGLSSRGQAPCKTGFPG